MPGEVNMSFRTKCHCVAAVAALLVGVAALPGRGTAQPAPAAPTEDEAKLSRYIKALDNKDPLVRKQVVNALGAIGPKARAAIPALREMLLDPNEEVKAAAAAALEKIGREQPRDSRDRLRRALQESEEQRAKLSKLLEAAKEEAQEQNKVLRVERERTLKALDLERDRSKELQEARRKAEAENRHARDALAAAAAEADRRRVEARRARNEVAAQEKKLLDLEQRVITLRDRAVVTEVEANALKDRNVRLLERIRELEALRTGKDIPPGTPLGRNPPPKDVEGIVLDVDRDSGLLKLSLGSDSGLAKGNTLEVFRLKPAAKYLGTVVVVEVRPREAVAKPLKPPKGDSFQKGDQVASRIVSQR
jgi:hypothetical protein